MREIRTDIVVDAPPRVVWDVLTDLPAYPEWNPHVRRAEGDLRVGAELDIEVHREGARDRTMTVTVIDLEPERRLAWVGSLVSEHIFEGRHVVELDAVAGDRTRVVNREQLSGVLAPLVVTDEPERDYEGMNRALKDRAQARLQPSERRVEG